jgi:hypothetical protein
MSRSFRFLTSGLAGLLLLALAALAVRGIVDPKAGALAFGVAAIDPSAEFYHAVYRDRNLVLAAAGLVYLAAGMWRALAVLTTAAVTLPVYDIVALKAAQAPVAPLHVITLTALVVLAVLLWLRAADHGGRRPAENAG